MVKLTASAQLLLANKELALQNKEKEQRASELLTANFELSFQNSEKEKRAAELIIANQELAYQNLEKEKRAAELVLANIELSFQNSEKEKRAAELIIANKELILHSEERERKAIELSLAYKELRKVEKHLKEHIVGLEEMMFITSHKVRKPVVNILGLSSLFEESIESPSLLLKLIEFLKLSAEELDDFTKELTVFIGELEKKGNV